MTTRQEYIVLKRKLNAHIQDVRRAKVDVVSYFLKNRYPDLNFRITLNPNDEANLNISVEIANVDTAETNVVGEAVNTFLRNIDTEVKKGDTCTTTINPTL